MSDWSEGAIKAVWQPSIMHHGCDNRGKRVLDLDIELDGTLAEECE